jgi:hypothetical protein
MWVHANDLIPKLHKLGKKHCVYIPCNCIAAISVILLLRNTPCQYMDKFVSLFETLQ